MTKTRESRPRFSRSAALGHRWRRPVTWACAAGSRVRHHGVTAFVHPSAPYRVMEQMDEALGDLDLFIGTNQALTNRTGHPVMSIPNGFSQGSPTAWHPPGKPYGEQKILLLAHAFQAKTDFHLQHPGLYARALRSSYLRSEICVRCITRRAVGSNASRRCIVQRLSQSTRSPARH